MAEILGKIKEKVRRLSGKIDQCEEGVPVAEAEQQSYAQESLQTDPAGPHPRKLVVVGKESIFSQEIIEYALEMAERMSYEIIALNTAPLSCETFKMFSASRKKICQDFEDLCKENVKQFREAAEQKGIAFTHIIKFSDSYEVLREIKHEIGEFEFVVSEMEEQDNDSQQESGERAKREIFVYSIM